MDAFWHGGVGRFQVKNFEIGNGLYAVLSDGENTFRVDMAEYKTKWGKAGTLI